MGIINLRMSFASYDSVFGTEHHCLVGEFCARDRDQHVAHLMQATSTDSPYRISAQCWYEYDMMYRIGTQMSADCYDEIRDLTLIASRAVPVLEFAPVRDDWCVCLLTVSC